MILVAKTDLLRLYPFEALAEISRFAAGLVQRVPKKPSFAKADLQNSTAILTAFAQGDGSWEGFIKKTSINLLKRAEVHT